GSPLLDDERRGRWPESIGPRTGPRRPPGARTPDTGGHVSATSRRRHGWARAPSRLVSVRRWPAAQAWPTPTPHRAAVRQRLPTTAPPAQRRAPLQPRVQTLRPASVLPAPQQV